MPKEIWNEGRVIGLSAYETYVKQHLSEDPLTPPATEREWLASSLAMGSSMLLKVPNVNQGATAHTYVDISLPSSSKLAAANTIVAQFFDGDATFQGDWAVRVTDYGQLIANSTSANSPQGTIQSSDISDLSKVPMQTLEDWDSTPGGKRDQLKDYLKILDGIIIQPGTWVASDTKPPYKDFQASLNGGTTPHLRLHVRGKITSNPRILLTGFTIRSVLAGVTGTDTVTESASPQDGDFLGPAVFPWASKIVFVVPNSYVTYFASGGYERQLPSTADAKEIKDTPVIDMQATRPEAFYGSGYTSRAAKFSSNTTNPRYAYNVTDYITLGDISDGDGEAVLTVYQRSDAYPPALYGTFVNSLGEHYLNPLDVVAPGTIKMFNAQSATTLADYESTFPGTSAMNRTADGTVQILNSSSKLISLAEVKDAPMTVTSPTGASIKVKAIQINTGKFSGRVLSVGYYDDPSVSDYEDKSSITPGTSTGTPSLPTRLLISQKPSASTAIALDNSNANDNISWSALFHALADNVAIDLLGNRLKAMKYTLQKPITGNASETSSQQKDTSKGSAYIEFGPDSNKIRLYICKEAPNPANVPLGSIGIGWGLES